MFSSAVQPALVSLFSSTGSDPLTLFSSHSDDALPADSLICLLTDSTSSPRPLTPAALISISHDEDEARSHEPDYTLDQTVLHIQSPTLRTTYIRCPPVGWLGTAQRASERRADLCLEHPWIHMQVRNLSREWSFEVGVVDHSDREGVVRCSTFQKEPRLYMGNPPLLHLPLAFPKSSSRPLTSWSTITLNLSSLLPHFSSGSLLHHDGQGAEELDSEEEYPESDIPHSDDAAVPGGTYAHVSYVKVYATCRLRRIWFTENGPRQIMPWEFELYAAS